MDPHSVDSVDSIESDKSPRHESEFVTFVFMAQCYHFCPLQRDGRFEYHFLLKNMLQIL